MIDTTDAVGYQLHVLRADSSVSEYTITPATRCCHCACQLPMYQEPAYGSLCEACCAVAQCLHACHASELLQYNYWNTSAQYCTGVTPGAPYAGEECSSSSGCGDDDVVVHAKVDWTSCFATYDAAGADTLAYDGGTGGPTQPNAQQECDPRKEYLRATTFPKLEDIQRYDLLVDLFERASADVFPWNSGTRTKLWVGIDVCNLRLQALPTRVSDLAEVLRYQFPVGVCAFYLDARACHHVRCGDEIDHVGPTSAISRLHHEAGMVVGICFFEGKTGILEVRSMPGQTSYRATIRGWLKEAACQVQRQLHERRARPNL